MCTSWQGVHVCAAAKLAKRKTFVTNVENATIMLRSECKEIEIPGKTSERYRIITKEEKPSTVVAKMRIRFARIT
jgi:hypothetical protein